MIEDLLGYDVDWFDTIYLIVYGTWATMFVIGIIYNKNVYKTVMRFVSEFRKPKAKRDPCNGEHMVVMVYDQFGPAFYKCLLCKRNTVDGSLRIDYNKIKRILEKSNPPYDGF